eukprot:1630323-Prorocentrum_lima.AAC.1
MTSSLVGSEMCIRDRHCSNAVNLIKRNRRFHEYREMRQNIEVGSAELASVSYTHLTLPTICSV